MSCSRRGSHLLHGNDCRPVVYVVASVEDLDAIAHLGRAELGRGRRRGPPGRRPRPASWIFRCHGGFFIMWLAAVGPGATILVLAPGLSTWCQHTEPRPRSLHIGSHSAPRRPASRPGHAQRPAHLQPLASACSTLAACCCCCHRPATPPPLASAPTSC